MQDPRSYPCSHFVTKPATDKTLRRSGLESAPPATAAPSTVAVNSLSEAKALPALEWILSEKSRAKKALDRTRELQDDEPDAIRERILSRMALQSAKEENAHFYDDRSIALITVIKAARGDATPFADAVFSVLRCRPDQVFARLIENRKNKLGQEYRSWFDAAGNLRPDIPKLPSARERRRAGEKERRSA
jgi:hypothetical protein